LTVYVRLGTPAVLPFFPVAAGAVVAVVVRVLVDDLLLELELLLPQAAMLSTTTSTLGIVSFVGMEHPLVDC
jgi:hypothetical protein